MKTLVEEGKFRDDLYYRLNIVTINIPPLRERREDIPLLVDYLLKKINRDLHKNIVGVSKEMMDVFMKYGWPGNVRELENILVRAAVVAKGQVLGHEDFPDLLGGTQVTRVPAEPAAEEGEETGFETLDEVEERHIRRVIARVGRNKGEICEILGISRPTLERKLEKYGIHFD
jgi:two-component system response regulator AtoC